MLTWEDTYLIAKKLREQNPDMDLEEVSLDMIFQWTINLSDFSDNLELANESILMAIFQKWIEEV